MPPKSAPGHSKQHGSSGSPATRPTTSSIPRPLHDLPVPHPHGREAPTATATAGAHHGGGGGGGVRAKANSVCHAIDVGAHSAAHHVHDATHAAVAEGFRDLFSLVSLLACSLPAVLALLLFSDMGYGTTVTKALHGHAGLSGYCLGGSAFLMLALYLNDVSYWRGSGCLMLCRQLLLGAVLLGLAAGLILKSRDYPAGPPALLLLGIPAYFHWLRGARCLFDAHRAAHTGPFLSAMAGFLLIDAAALAGAFVYSALFAGRSWSDGNKARLQREMGCNATLTDLDVLAAAAAAAAAAGGSDGGGGGGGDDPAYLLANANACLSAYLLWLMPFIAALCCFVFAVVAYFLARSVHRDKLRDDASERAEEERAAREQAAPVTEEERARLAALDAKDPGLDGGAATVDVKAGRVRKLRGLKHLNRKRVRKHARGLRLTLRAACLLLFLAVMGMWVAASLAGAGMQLSNAVTTFIGAAVVLLVGMLTATLGWRRIGEELSTIPLLAKLKGTLESDWLKGFALLTASPAFALFCALSWLNQTWRTCCGIFGVEPGDDAQCTTVEYEKEDWDSAFTPPCRKMLQRLKGWRWASVLECAIWIGIIFLTFNVGVGKVVTLFLASLNKALAPLPLATVTALFYSIGVTMFLLPPVPGVPVYLAGGVILVNKARGTALGFWGAVAYTIGVCFSIKILAIAIQQKGIGERMSGSVAVRKAVGVNSLSIRAIRKILETPGMDKRKVFILCGGPDWPISVLTGILKLSLKEMLIGSMPVVLLVGPCVCAGAFMLRKGEGGSWGALASVTLAVAAMAQIFAMAAAAYYIEQVAAEHHEELAAQPLDEAVAAAEAADRRAARSRKRITHWEARTFGMLPKFLLVCGTACTAACCYLVQFYADACFRPFEVTGDIDLPLALGGLDGKAANLVIAPAGTWAVRFVACACAFLFAYRLWLRFALVLHGGVTEGCCACFVRSALCWLHPVSLLDAAAAEEAEMVELDGGNKGGGAMAAGGGDAGSPQGERMQRVAHEAMMLQSLVLSTPGHAAEQAKGQTEQVL